MATLTILSGENEGKTHKIDPPVVFGRSDETEITISDPRISREHGRFLLEEDVFYLKDLDSSNGTEVNGERIERTRIEDGDRIEAGRTEMAFLLDKEEKETYARKNKEAEESETDQDQEGGEQEQKQKEEPEQLDEEPEPEEHPPGEAVPEPVPEAPSQENRSAGELEAFIPEWALIALGVIVIGGVFLVSYYLTKVILPILFPG